MGSEFGRSHRIAGGSAFDVDEPGDQCETFEVLQSEPLADGRLPMLVVGPALRHANSPSDQERSAASVYRWSNGVPRAR